MFKSQNIYKICGRSSKHADERFRDLGECLHHTIFSKSAASVLNIKQFSKICDRTFQHGTASRTAGRLKHTVTRLKHKLKLECPNMPGMITL